ncbi:MAG: RHS repeat-associated core domain-containing protein [Limnohabitans sp.]|nr:RHS repeat-associated core domain-containing protein [Limnohabitans sp.]
MQNQVTDYMQGGFQYKNNILLFFPQAEGYVNVAVVETNCTTCKPAQIIRSNNYTYVYNYTDHLGNIRLSYSLDPSTNTLKVMDENHYYPFGLKHNNYNSDTKMVMKSGTTSKIAVPPVEVKPFYNYKYNGKELQDELGLNMYDYGARNYDPALCRWMNIDPHSENYLSLSNYVAFANNPILFIDPTGEDINFWQINSKSGKWEQVSFEKLDKKVQKGILDFGKTKEGYSFLASFSNAGDKIGDLNFKKDGKYSDHVFNMLQTEGKSNSEGTSSARVYKDHVEINMEINKDMPNPSINMAETIGHEAFLHMEQDIHDLINTFDNKGFVAAFSLEYKQTIENKKGYKDHLAVKDDKMGRAKRYFEYITQLKSVLNPEAVQKHVNSEINKTYSAGQKDKPKK